MPTTEWLDVRKFLARGDGSNNDAPSFEEACNVAVRESEPTRRMGVWAPRPPIYYRLTTPISVQPELTAHGQMSLDIRASMPWHGMRWEGGSNTSIFRFRGLKLGTIDGLKVQCYGKDNVAAFDLDDDPTFGSTTQWSVKHCLVSFGNGATNVSTNSVGFRMGHGGGADVSYVNFARCAVSSFKSGAIVEDMTSNIGYSMEHQNVLIIGFDECAAYQLARGWNNLPTAGAAYSLGGSAFTLKNCGGTFNTADLYLAAAGTVLVSGGRFENGFHLVHAPFYSGAVYEITLDTVMIHGYDPANGRIIDIDPSCSLVIRNPDISTEGTLSPPPIYDANMIQLGGATQSSLIVEGGGIMASEPFYTLASPTVTSVEIRGAIRKDASNTAVGTFADPSRLENRDALINGGMEIFERSSPVVVTGGPGDVRFFLADHWYGLAHNGDSFTAAIETTEVAPTTSGRSLKIDCTARAVSPRVFHLVEDFKPFRGKLVTCRLWAKGPTNSIWVQINDGVGSSSGGANSGTAWQQVVARRQIEATATKLEIQINIGAVGVFYIDNADLSVGHPGPGIPPYLPDLPADKARAARYYQRIPVDAEFAATSLDEVFTFPVAWLGEMRATPTIAVVTAGTATNMAGGFPTYTATDARGGRVSLKSAAGGQCGIAGALLALDAEVFGT